MTIKYLDVECADHCQFVEDLYITAFPPEERRPINRMYSMYNADSPYSIDVIEENETIVGFITHWDFDQFIYVEHFSISGKHRNSGFGQKSMIEFMKKIYHRPIVLEVELDTDDMSKRRIGFYKRLGFELWNQLPYVQPPYTPSGSKLPMYLMTSGDIDLSSCFEEVKDTLYKKVYGAID